MKKLVYIPVILSAFVLPGLLSACSTSQGQTSIAVAAIGLTDAERAATIYTHLPRCAGASVLCSKQATVDRIKAADQTAYDAVKAAEKSGDAGAAAAALSAFNVILAEPDVQAAIQAALKQGN